MCASSWLFPGPPLGSAFMNLGQKTLLVVSLTVAGVMIVLYAVSRDVLLRSYLALEQEQTQSAVSRTEAALNDQITSLARTTNDYGEWDRTYAFMQHPSRSYIKQEFENDTLEGLHINSVMLTDTAQKIVFFKAYDSGAKAEVGVPIEIQRSVATDSWARQAAATSTPAQGILLLPQGPVLIAACPILTTAHLGPVQGVLVMTRNLDTSLVERLRERALSSVAIHLAAGASLQSDVRSRLFDLARHSWPDGSCVAGGNASIGLPARTDQLALPVGNVMHCKRGVRTDYVATAATNRAGSIDIPDRRGGPDWWRQVRRSFRANSGTGKRRDREAGTRHQPHAGGVAEKCRTRTLE